MRITEHLWAKMVFSAQYSASLLTKGAIAVAVFILAHMQRRELAVGTISQTQPLIVSVLVIHKYCSVFKLFFKKCYVCMYVIIFKML